MASQVAGYIGKLNPGNGTEYSLGSTAYGVCGTTAATTAKVVDMTGFTLIEGATIHVKFTYENTVTSPTLNVNSTGAKPIVLYGTTATGTTAETNGWQAGAVLCLTYDGTSWVRDQGYNTNTTYSAMSTSEAWTGTATTSRAMTAANLKSTLVNLGGTGLTLTYDATNGIVLNHSNSITTGTAGTSSATSGATLAVPYVTYDAQGHITATGTHTHTINSLAASTISSGTLDFARLPTMYWANVAVSSSSSTTTTPTFSTAILGADPTDNMQAATKQYVDNSFAVNDAMLYKGTLDGASTSPGSYTPAADAGHTYKVATAGYINGQPVEVGDLMICTTDSTVAATSSNYNTIKTKWNIINTNVDGAIFKSTNSLSSNYVLTTDGTTGKVKTERYLYANINSGTQNRIAYYSDTNAISSGTITTNGAYLSSVSYLSINTTHQTDYRLYVNGTSYHNGAVYFANGTTYYIDNSAQANLNYYTLYSGALAGTWGISASGATAGTEGWARLTLGNNTASSAANNYSGQIYWYNSNGSYTSWYSRYGTLGATENQSYVQMEKIVVSKIGFGNSTSNTTTYGSSTQPVYWNNGVPAECTKYADLFTAFTSSTNTLSITMGGTTKTASAINSVSNTLTAGTSTAAPKIKTTVNGVEGSDITLTTATTGIYGVTKLSSTSSSTEEGLAATPKGVWNAINTLDVSEVDGAGTKFVTKISQTDGKISATLSSSTISTQYIPVWVDNGVIKAITTNSVLTDLGSTTAASTYASAPRPGITGTLPVNHGGTGATSFTANSIIISGSTSTSALTTRAITNNTSNTAITASTNIPTMNTIYYGLVTVNGSSQSRATGIYAPTSVGTSGDILQSNGSGAPSWVAASDTWRTIQVNGTSIGSNTLNLKAGDNITLTRSSGDVTIAAPIFTGASSSTNGSSGSVPAPTSSQYYYFLRGDGTWAYAYYVYQALSSTNVWRKILATSNTASSATGTITSGSSSYAYYNDSIAMNPSTGQLYAPYLNANGTSTSYNLYVNGTSYLNGTLYQTGYIFIVSDRSRYNPYIRVQNAAGNTAAELFYDRGNTTNISSGVWYFREFSPNSTANTGNSGYYENYYLPTVTTGRTASATYDILTTKNHAAPSTGTESRIAYYSAAGTISAGTATTNGAYLGNVSYLSINTTHQTTYRLYVAGSTYTQYLWAAYGLGGASSYVYGSTLPSSNLYTGRIFFKI